MRYCVLFGIREKIKQNRSRTIGTSCQFWIYTQSFCVGKPGGKSYCQSFGRMQGQGWCFQNCRGHVYQDKKSGGPIDPSSYRTSSAADDARIEKEIRRELTKKDRYDFFGFPGNNCRAYSQALFGKIDAKYKGTAAQPPGTE